MSQLHIHIHDIQFNSRTLKAIKLFPSLNIIYIIYYISSSMTQSKVKSRSPSPIYIIYDIQLNSRTFQAINLLFPRLSIIYYISSSITQHYNYKEKMNSKSPSLIHINNMSQPHIHIHDIQFNTRTLKVIQLFPRLNILNIIYCISSSVQSYTPLIVGVLNMYLNALFISIIIICLPA